jgi:hypothetical protein
MPGAPDVARRCFAWPAAHGEDTLGCHHIGMVAVATVFTREQGLLQTILLTDRLGTGLARVSRVSRMSSPPR